MTMSINLVMIPQNELDLLTKAKSVTLTSLDWEVLVERWDVFKKFLKKAQFSYQISLSEGKHRWKEEAIYNKIEWLNEVIKSLENIGDTMEAFQQKKAEEEEKKKNLKKT